MKKLYPLIFAIFFITIIVLPFVSCVSTNEVTTTQTTETEKPKENKKPVSFEIDFAEKLQALLAENKIEEAIALFDELPKKYEKDI